MKRLGREIMIFQFNGKKKRVFLNELKCFFYCGSKNYVVSLHNLISGQPNDVKADVVLSFGIIQLIKPDYF